MLDRRQKRPKLVTASQHAPVLRDQRPHPLAVAQRGPLLDLIFRILGRAAECPEGRRVSVEVDGVILPQAGRDHAAVNVDDARKLPALETHLR